MEKVTNLFDRLPLFAKSRRLKHQNPTGIAGKEKGRRWISVSQEHDFIVSKAFAQGGRMW